jgi:hypothetical protein
MKRYWTGWLETLLPALGVLAYGWGMAVACPPVVVPEEDGAMLPGLPEAHPERMVAHVPPTPVEQALWAQLGPFPA